MPILSSLYRAPILLIPMLVVLLAGCSRFTKPAAPADPLRLYLRLDSPAMRPGEPLIVEALLLNTTPEPILCSWLNHNSLTFYLQSPLLNESVRVWPVYSEKEQVIAVQELASDNLWSRKFVFTQATETSGTYSLSAAFQQNPEGALPVSYFAASAPVEYRVNGAWAARRDRNGILLKDEAIRRVRERVDESPAQSEARLIVNEAGFYDWFVRLTFLDASQQAWLVNPYLATVRKQADPALFPSRVEQPIPKVLKKD